MAIVRFVAGKEEHLKERNIPTVIIDFGFSKSKASTGIGWVRNLEEELKEPKNLRTMKYGSAVNEIIKQIHEFVKQHETIHIIIEAPLSTKFDKDKNPTGRGDFEKKGKSTRYWYQYGGLLPLIAAGHFIRNLVKSFETNKLPKPYSEIRFFEGFISFKEDDNKSDDKGDVKQLLRAVQAIAGGDKKIKIGGKNYEVKIEKVEADNAEEIINIFYMFNLNDDDNNVICVPCKEKAPVVIVVDKEREEE